MMSSNTSSTIRLRLIEIIKQGTDETRRFKSLEQMTRISGATWRTFWNRTGVPSGEMIEAIATQWPQYAFWLATGGTDPLAGHIAPSNVDDLLEDQNEEIPEATEYFHYQMKLREEQKPSLLDTTGFKQAMELVDDGWQRKISHKMPPGSLMYAERPVKTADATLSELLSAQERSLSDAYLAARDELLREMLEEKRQKLHSLKRRKAVQQNLKFSSR